MGIFHVNAVTRGVSQMCFLVAMIMTPTLVLAQTSAAPVTPTPPVTENADLTAHKTKDGVLFQVSSVATSTVFLAGDFNNWAGNTNSQISDMQYKMDGPDAKNVFSKTVKLDPGPHKFKFVIDGTWTAPDWVKERDTDGNGVIYTSGAGDVLLKNPVNSDWKPSQKDGKTTFQLYYPSAKSVYLVGDFNNWGSVKNDVVSDASCAMQGPDANGVWTMTVALSPGTHMYKFVIDGSAWEFDPNGDKLDAQGNSSIDVSK
jgi:1,4-alpha-glucan branching enzyme